MKTKGMPDIAHHSRPMLRTWITAFMLLAGFVVYGQEDSHSLSLHMNAPDWHTKEVCDPGKGYQPALITAPTISLVYKQSNYNLKDAQYEYVWMQQIGAEEWKTVQTGKSDGFVPPCKPGMLHHDGTNKAPIKISWKLKVRDLANQTAWAESDIYYLTLASTLNVTYTTRLSAKDNKKTTIDLTVSGGFSSKSITWTSEKGEGEVPLDQMNLEDPDGLIPGTYKVVVTDGCNTKALTISTHQSQ